MKLIRNTGNERVIDVLREWISPGSKVDLLSPTISIHAFAELQRHLDNVDGCRLLLDDQEYLQSVFGGPEDITSRGKLQVRWQARLLANWLSQHSDVRLSSSRPSQSIIVVETDNIRRALLGTCAFTTQGLGITPADQLALVLTSLSTTAAGNGISGCRDEAPKIVIQTRERAQRPKSGKRVAGNPWRKRHKPQKA